MKKGFTLIELLAVIVILAVIAAIAIPIIINVIEDSRRGAAIASGNGYVRAVNYKIAQEVLNNREVDETVDYVIGENELALTGTNLETITGSYVLSNSRVLWAGLCINGYSVEYNAVTGHTGISNNNYCNGDSYEFIEPEAELMSVVCTNSSKYDSEDSFKIKTVEDLACLSNLSNSGKNFNNKTIYLLEDIDFNSDSSYKDKNTTSYGDINGNGTVEALKVELTTGKGFKPIGNNSTKFKGTFDGYAFTISNLMINRDTQYTGLFGYSEGIIEGIKLRNANVTGTSNTGILVGYNTGAVRSIDAQGTVTGTSSVGGVVGQSYYGSLTYAMFQGSVTGTGGSTGGVLGYSRSANVYGATHDSTITVTGNYDVAAVVGHYYESNNNKASISYNNTITKQETVSYSATGLDDYIGLLDGGVDTVLGGDNDSDGYYFDYDKDGNVVLYSTARNPLDITKLKGEGSQESPYLIKNAKDWKLATTTVTQSKYYAVINNIDFNNGNFYPFGSSYNRFNGNFNGNLNTISNISIEGISYVGLFGYNVGTIEGLSADNVTINAKGNNIGLVAGYNEGTVKGIKGRNITISSTSTDSNSYVGGIIGQSKSATIKSIDLKATVTSGGGNTAGIVGYNYATTTKDTLFRGNVTGTNYVGGIAGYARYAIQNAIFGGTITSGEGAAQVGAIAAYHYDGNENDTIYRSSTSTFSGVGSSSQQGSIYYDTSINEFDNALDTYIGGDNDSDGYYFDYDEDGDISLFSTAITPIINTLDGAGTQADPYIIKSAEDWRVASSTAGQNKYYELKANIDFSNKKFYALGTKGNVFSGTIKGNLYTLSNITIRGYSYVGLFSKNKGTIEGLSLNNITVRAGGNYVGAITGYNEGTIKGIKGRNITVASSSTSSSSYVGGIAGESYWGTVKSIDLIGNVSSNGGYTAGIIGYNYGSTPNYTLFRGSVTGTNYVAGITGYTRYALQYAMVDGTITASEGAKQAGAASADYYDGRTNGTVYRSSTTTYTAGTGSFAQHGTVYTNEASVTNALDTTDSDSDTYYFKICDGKYELFTTTTLPLNSDTCTVNIPVETPTHLGIVYLNPKNTSQSCNAQNSVSTTGTKEGCMKFYIIGEDSTNYKLLLDHNTSSNVSWANQADFIEAGGDLSEWQTNEGSTSRGPVTANKKLLSDTTGWTGNPRLPNTNEIAHITGADTSLAWNSSKTYASPVTDKSTQIGNYYFDGNGSNYSGWTSQVANSTNKSKYAWLFDNTTNCLQYGCNIEDNNEYSGSAVHGYWTSDASSINYPWAVVESGQLGRNNVTNATNVGIRPVITLSKSSVTVH